MHLCMENASLLFTPEVYKFLFGNTETRKILTPTKFNRQQLLIVAGREGCEEYRTRVILFMLYNRGR